MGTKAISTKLAKDKKDLTTAEMTAQLTAAGIKVDAKATKDDVFALYSENLDKVEMMLALEEASKHCLTKSFGAHGDSKLCTKCKKTQKDVYTLCSTANKESKKAKKAAKRVRKMGHRTGTATFGTRKGTMANKFANALVKAGDKGLTMAEARKAKWNSKGYRFNESAARLEKEGLIVTKDGRMYITKAGVAEATPKKAA